MKKVLMATGAAIVAMSAAAPAMAWEGKTAACYEKKFYDTQYKVSHEMVKPSKQQYEHRNGRIELVVYPPVYREIRTQTFPAHYVMVPVACH